jgi:D-3-phosphoglycerate dehydrogenase / 2-oxoglutarate reductase
MRFKVVISAPYMQPVVDRFCGMFKEENCEVIVPTVNERLNEPELLKMVGDVHGFISGDDRFTRKVLGAAKQLRVISKWGTGIDSIDRKAASEMGIRVCNTPNAFTQPVSDSVLAIMLTFARRIPWQDREMKEGPWVKQPGVSLAECTLGIIGVGNIGKAVARKAAAFGMNILGCDPQAMPEDFLRETNIRMVSRDELLKESDFVTVNCDLNPTSVHLMSDRQFSMMKANAVLVNTARGPIVDEVALVKALKEKQIAGAGLDVFEAEPLPRESALLKMENVLLSAHNSNSSPAAWERVHQNTLKNLFNGLKEVTR